MRIEREGSGPPVVLIPGLGCDHRMWRPVGSRLAGRFEVIYPETWGRESLSEAALGIAGSLAELGAGPACVAGLSMGGYIAFELIRQWPHRVRAGAFLDTTAFADTAERLAKRRQALHLLAEGRFEEVLGTFVTSVLTPEHAGGPLKALLLSMATTLGADVFAGDSEAILSRGNYEDVLQALRVPALFAAGEQDPLTPPSLAARMAAEVPGSRAEAIAGASHMAALENPDRVAELLGSFFCEVLARR